MPDFEDAVVAVTAERAGSTYILTRNLSDFAEARVPVLTPVELLKQLAES